MKYCPNCDAQMPHKNRGIIYFLLWPLSMLFWKKRCIKCGTKLR